MLYYLAQELTPYFSALNVFSYLTVRAGGAMLTGFLFCLLVGPRIIARLRQLKVGQHIKKDHVENLHALHKGKAGTPTMGGAIIVVATVMTLLLWSTLTNRLLIAATFVFVVLGAVGFVDDYIKLRRKHNDGLSARAKLLGQLGVGFALGLFVVLQPITYGAAYLASYDVVNWNVLVQALRDGNPPGVRPYAETLGPDAREALAEHELTPAGKERILIDLNRSFERADIYDPAAWETSAIAPSGVAFAAVSGENLSMRDAVQLNRQLFEALLPEAIKPSPRRLQTKVGLPGFKDTLIPLGLFYIAFVVLIIVASSNSVNLTDGLDGLAAGASVISIFAFTGIAYIVSRADWSDYLYVFHVPEAAELTVFGAALLGAGLGFLWFNAHPAEVFMGDTGSLALGGAIGAMAILTKQELLLPIVGGLFVIEAMSVVIQVASFKTRGKRVFLMAPLHHHFELKGWSESKVTIRFWIIALVFALLSLSTLKLR